MILQKNGWMGRQLEIKPLPQTEQTPCQFNKGASIEAPERGGASWSCPCGLHHGKELKLAA